MIHFIALKRFESVNLVYEHACVGIIVRMTFGADEYCAYCGVWLHVNYVLKIAAL